jgi:hypothetical protein
VTTGWRHGPSEEMGAASLPPTVAGEVAEVVAVPAHPGAARSGELYLEVRQLPDASRVLPVFSTVRKLVDALGQSQPWAVLPLERARQTAAAAGIELVALDPAVSPATWKWGPEDLGEFAQRRHRHE